MKPVEIKAQDIHSWAEERVRKQRLPLPAQPRGKELEYEFPDDPTSLSNTELGQLMGRFIAWLGRCQWLLGWADSESVLVEAEYRLKINSRGVEARERLGRVSADVIEAAVLEEDGELTPLYQRRLELIAVKAQLESRLKIYERQWQGLSRELARRELEARLL